MEALAVLAVIGGFIYLLVQVNRLSAKTRELEDTVSNLRRFVVSGDDLWGPKPWSQTPSAGERKAESDSVPNSVDDLPETVADAVRDEPLDIPAPAQAAYEQAPVTTSPVTTAPDLSERFGDWLRENWFYAVSAICLSLAGIFLIHYGIERGLLTPEMRVACAVALGLALIGAGDFLRRRVGDDAPSHTAYLPSTLSGAGIVVIFVAILGARHLYGLIGAEMAFTLLAGLSVATVVMGWLYGPVLTVIGLLGATLAPFIVGGESESVDQFFYYFALIALTGLLVDTVKQWLWPSALALAFTYAAASMLFLAHDADVHFIAFALIVALGAIIIPNRKLWPDHAGIMLSEALWGKNRSMPHATTLIAAVATVASYGVVLAVALVDRGLTEMVTVLVVLGLMQLASVVWLRDARALTDMNLIPPLLFFAILVMQAVSGGSLHDYIEDNTGVAMSSDALVALLALVAFGVAGSVLAFYRARIRGSFDVHWGFGLALYAPVTLVLLEIFWEPQQVLGAEGWGLVGIAIAAMMTLFAERLARIDGADKMRVSLAALAALTMLGFALVVTLTSVALTIAMALMVLVAVLIDRRFDLPLLTIFVQVGVVLVSSRLIITPGVLWALDAPLVELLAVYGGSIGLLAASWHYIRGRERIAARTMIDSAVLSLPFVLGIILLLRALDNDIASHWGASLLAMICLLSAAVQYYRLQVSTGFVRQVRVGLCGIFGVASALAFTVAMLVLSPLRDPDEIVFGPLVADTLLVAYGLPALLFGGLLYLFGRQSSALKPEAKLLLAWLMAAFGGLYVVLEIRRFWRGDILSVPGTTNPELYSYTLLMILTSAVLLLLTFFRRSPELYRIAVVGVGLTLAKAFLIDMAGLDGLLRVVSFLGLGLILAALAWLNVQVRQRISVSAAVKAVE
ncbi:MAG TPA: hypothetical protein DFI00_07250 [Rhodospirillaceae bacterium]|nr:hypothetical protein [Alphaproteobacteria bacterium]MAS46940.1 hypothetical protein [Alphaproteobacteria bacterium]MBN53510.1 hypothetical protein [Alphaproteobacteria bacterium]OUT41503.1 MAG: hypothetical protein CBB62_03970 [Micavibrio sp. TMED2]HCI47073.1 hypothetical protein [Rhodospirillaceae bacterium]|tara:strand:- start:23855 stop:26587 length:2733 start_codon:yes stop_codon:yes gene_type:complete